MIARVFRSGRVIAAATAVAALTGCAGLGAGPAARAPVQAPIAAVAPGAAPSAVLGFVAAAAPGASVVVVDPYFGGEVTARLEAEYLAASGRQCRRFSVAPGAAGGPGQIFHACLSDGAWVLAGLY